MDKTDSRTLFSNPGVNLKISSLTKTYRTSAEEVHALKGIDWEVYPAEASAIMGPSGCGKTTLLNLLGGMDSPTSGQIIVGDQEIASLGEREREGYRLFKVGFVFQFFNLIPTLTVLENQELPMLIAGMDAALRRQRGLDLLRLVGLEGKADKRPEEISGGEQQRVAITLALANDPSLILADEPTGNLDSENTEIIANLFRMLAESYGKTVIMVSHNPKAVERFTKVYHMRDGRFLS